MNNTQKPSLNRQILGLALPALGAMLAEPAFRAFDTAMVGHLGDTALAGVGVSAAIMSTAVNLMVFLAYATTPFVAKYLGAGDRKKAMQAGVDGLFLAGVIGILLSVFIMIFGGLFIPMFHVEHSVANTASAYLSLAALGIPAMMLVFAATGFLRGLMDTRTPLYISVAGFIINAILNAFLIYGVNMGVAGSALGTVIAQWLMVSAYIFVINKHIRQTHTSWLPRLASLKSIGGNSAWLLLRTASLRVAALATISAATAHSTQATAAFQIVFTLLAFVAYGLDAIAIAAQSLIGHAIGENDTAKAHILLKKLTVWGAVCGAVLTIVLLPFSAFIGRIFTADTAILDALPAAIALLAISLPLQGVVYVLDGVLMGSADSRYLAIVGALNLVVLLPVIWVISTTSGSHDATWQLALVTGSWCFVYMLSRLAGLGLRARTNHWIHTPQETGKSA